MDLVDKSALYVHIPKYVFLRNILLWLGTAYSTYIPFLDVVDQAQLTSFNQTFNPTPQSPHMLMDSHTQNMLFMEEILGADSNDGNEGNEDNEGNEGNEGNEENVENNAKKKKKQKNKRISTKVKVEAWIQEANISK